MNNERNDYNNMVEQLAAKYSTSKAIIHLALDALNQIGIVESIKLTKAFPKGCTQKQAIEFFILDEKRLAKAKAFFA